MDRASHVRPQSAAAGRRRARLARAANAAVAATTVNLVEPLEGRTLFAYTLQILHASDLEGGVPALDDAPRFSAVVNGLRDDFANTAILSSGDNWIPGPFYAASDDPSLNAVPSIGAAGRGRGDVAIMNEIGFQAAAFGNHEFDQGPRTIRDIIAPAGAWSGAKFPYLSANLDFAPNVDLASLVVANGQEASSVGNGKIAKSAVLTINGTKLGIVGVTTPLLPQISSPGTVVTKPNPVSEPLTAANLAALAAEVQPSINALTAAGVHKIVVMAHLQNLDNELALTPFLKDVDVIIAGGSHEILADANDRLRAGDASNRSYPLPVATTHTDGSAMTTYVVNTGSNWKYVGRLVADFDEVPGKDDVVPGSINPAVSGAYPADAQGVADVGGAPDPEVVAITDALRNVIATKDANVFGKTAVYLEGDRAFTRSQETNLGNLTADANLWAAMAFDDSVVLSLKNGGGIRDPIGTIDPPTGAKLPPQANGFKGTGDVSQLDIENSLRFNNALSLVTLNAVQLKAIMEHSVAAGFNQGRFPQIGGFSFAFDANRPVGSRVLSIAVKDAAGHTVQTVVENGVIAGDPARTFRMVTLNFLAAGGDSYPFPSFGDIGRVDLLQSPDAGGFAPLGSEQRALADYLAEFHAVTPFAQPDVPQGRDARIQNLAIRSDTVNAPVPTNAIELTRIGSFKTGGFGVGAAEITAYEPETKRLFVVNAQAGTVDVLSLADPANPTKVKTLNVSDVGLPNSVAVSGQYVAVAVQAPDKVSKGKVVLYQFDSLKRLNALTVGSLPDMVTFSPDGKSLLVANEGEPDGYLATSTDPEGSVSIVPIPNGVGNVKKLKDADVRTASFAPFNAQKAALQSQGVRIFGPDPKTADLNDTASVAQDLEPEYIALSADSKTAYVTLQENNAYAVIDVATATVTAIIPLGARDYNATTVTGLATYTFENLPSIGSTAAGQELKLGGFSGLQFDGYAANGNLKFITHTDRGPNGEPITEGGVDKRPFLLPNFTPEVVRFELNPTTGQLTLTQRVQLKDKAGALLSGRPNTSVVGGGPSTPFNDEVPIDLTKAQLPLDPLGGDFEGIAVDPADGSFWMVDEYRPAIYKFRATDGNPDPAVDTTGWLIERYVPIGTVAAHNAGRPAGEQVPAGFFGKEVLPAVLGQRRQNRGFEGVAFQDGRVVAFVQSPLRNPASATNATLNGNRNVRVVEFNPATETARQFLYVMDNPAAAGAGNTRADKIGDAAAIGNGEFLLVERDDDAIDSDPAANIEKKIYRFGLAGATELTASLEATVLANTGKTVDQLTPAELAANGVNIVAKVLHVDLNAAGYNTVEKVEGLTAIGRDKLAVLNDNDFGVAGIAIDFATGTFTPDPNAEPVRLGIIDTDTVGLDASDRDNAIRIAQRPVKGLFMPDAIAAYTAGGEQFLVTANEGDARDYAGFAEEVRVSAATLDPLLFPNRSALRDNAVLGRLTVTRAGGANTDADAELEQILAFGSRSFSIRKADGTLVYDSGDDFEQITAEALPLSFNASNDNNNFDDRSDNKGPEAEGVVLGAVGDRTYAFVGLERIGGVMVYDVTDPSAVQFVQYLNTRDFTAAVNTAAAGDLGPEGLTFIAADKSPSGTPLLIVANEVSGTIGVFQIDAGGGAPAAATPAAAATARVAAGLAVPPRTASTLATAPSIGQSLFGTAADDDAEDAVLG